ncbi:MAG: phospholipase [SAR86 cluster bacterium]|uniref:Phospholipase n=1 Tax=SAR86 cluster bacterium TaxID=2030880 RepID=A0A520MXA5_9GAMM|nr:MAG: phospholipase [SAR86 cluster bacterium]
MKNFFSYFSKFNQKKIICFDGGGVRTIAALVFLKKLEAESGKKVADIFDMFIGTSAGAFNAACFAFGGFSADKVKKYWSKSYLDKIMKSSFFWDKASLIQARPRYESEGRAKLLNQIFKSNTLKESNKPFLCYAYDIEKRTHVVFDTANTPNTLFTDAIAASSAAPMYFPTHQMKDKSWMIDGSIVSNNPTLIGYSYSKKILEANNIKILSLGSGLNKKKIKGDISTKWGGVGWLRNDIIGMLLDSEIHNEISNDFFSENYLRINSSLGKINKFLDDDSEENLEKIHLMGMDWWTDYGEKALKFIDS